VSAPRPALALGLLAVAFVALAWHLRGPLLDDAYIVFRYADHLLAGHGPVFNPGERVEGFTSPLWLGLMAASRALGAGYDAAASVLGAIAGLCCLPAGWLLARRVVSPAPALLAPALLALHPGFALWSVHGLETALVTLLLTLALAAWAAPGHRGAWLAGLALGAAFWTRPETPLVALVLAAMSLARGERSRALRLLAALAVVALPLEVARLGYYGSVVPNTFHAKTGGLGGRLLFGLAEARAFTVTHLALVVACTAAAVGWPRRRRERPALVGDLLAVGVAWSAYVIWAGGDAFPAHRFFVPVLPAAGAVAAWAVGTRAAAAAAVVLWCAAGSYPAARLERDSGGAFTEKMTAAGRWLGAHAPPATSLAVNYVGALPYHARLRTIDMLGLTDPIVARTPIRGRFRFTGHARGNGASVLDRRPDLILMNGVYLEPQPMRTLSPELDSEEQIAADPRFALEYERIQVRIPGPGGVPSWFAFYLRRDAAWRPATETR
jgi:arabinofuranosyltransferase